MPLDKSLVLGWSQRLFGTLQEVRKHLPSVCLLLHGRLDLLLLSEHVCKILLGNSNLMRDGFLLPDNFEIVLGAL